ncbi:GntR family transcriptional regulator [Catenulispora sp. NF23]|uniref:GntR family transcriptional regulator n=1 Tax=Catenulispora pinistramenti TaxID=2705254 RepID=A0ABS5KJ38_9ACTN|nr:GntR family transcriptional regulator [Catenulispora pinistramenti]MBS2531257.1 GntR family transcriptional regulator [Catenulispora pinistramenti]MBS2545935.1 GntR family transcriptional regulator [Catenulispora pinistramenti]
MKRVDDRPQSAQIAADLRAKILSGDITGTLPTFERLKVLYSTSINTAQRAVAMLKAEGFVEGRQGKALIIRSDRIQIVDASSQLEPPTATITYQVLHVGHERPPTDAAQKLGLADGETALLRKRLMLRDDEPVEIEWSYYPEAVVTGTALDHQQRDLTSGPTVLAALGYEQHGLVDEIQVREPTTEELQTLELPDEIPVMRTLRTITDASGAVLEVTVMITSGHLYAVRYQQTLPPSA